MKIENENETVMCSFVDIDIGECFKFNKAVYLKTYVLESEKLIAGRVNCVNLENGSHCLFRSDLLVTKLNTKLIIEGEST